MAEQDPQDQTSKPADGAAEPPAAAPAEATPPAEPKAAAPPAPPADSAAPPPEPQPAAPPAASAEAQPEAPKAPEVTGLVPGAPAPPKKTYVWGTGRRKQAVARVRIRPGTGKFRVNKRDAEEYFKHDRDRQAILAPLTAAKMLKSWDIWANVRGGGYTGQAGAVVLGLARALVKAAPQSETALRDQGLLTRDARMKERKKPGQPGARRRFQFSKR